MSDLLFVYGTLKNPVMQKRICGKVFSVNRDTLDGHKVIFYRFADGIYPLIVPSPNDSVQGMILKNIEREDWKKLDGYEGNDYQRVEKILSSGKKAWVYIAGKRIAL